jgi:selenocysteine-specific translation elongation factor
MSNKCLDCVPTHKEECNVCEGMKEIKNAAIGSYKALKDQDIKELKARIKELEQELADAREVNEQHRLLNGRLRVRIDTLEDLLKKIQPFIDEINGDYAIDGD